MKIIGLLFFVFGITTHACEIQQSMTNEQWYNVAKGYYAAEPHGYGLTLAAIIINESQAGLYRVNPESKDYGLTQISIKTAIDRMGYNDTPFMRSVVASRLVFDDELAIELAIEELLYWDGRRNGEWKYVVASYNSGNDPSNGLKYYYPKIARTVHQLKYCFVD
ncbi:MAG: transglycosylase SLT domain-containing protein [Nitrosopumilaceae archaeon]|nr:transglycosylase SLT domain-containing protein [Nitrosopumilaceae archaeon]